MTNINKLKNFHGLAIDSRIIKKENLFLTIKGKNNVTSGTVDVDPFLWEAYYSFRPNDSIEITPGIFGGTDVYEEADDDIFGAVLTTTFRF